MHAPAHPRNHARLAALRSLEILDTPRERSYDQIVELVAEVCEAPIAVINLIDEKRQWFKAEVGLGVRETPLETSICSHVILQPGLTVIHDTLGDARLAENPLCINDPHVRFYAGVCLDSEEGLPIGTLCVLDTKPRDLTETQRRFLTILADQVMVQINLTRQLRLAEMLRQEVDHRVKNSLSVVQAVLSFQASRTNNAVVRDQLKQARLRLNAITSVHDQLHVSASPAQDVKLKDYLERLADTIVSQAADGIVLDADLPHVTVKARDANNLGLIVSELITNALRHGLDGRETGTIKLHGRCNDEGLRLSIEDDGAGLPDDFTPDGSDGLGMSLALMLIKGLAGDLECDNTETGARFSFAVPIECTPVGYSAGQPAAP